MVLEQRLEGDWINTSVMTDLSTLAATLLTNFATVRLRHCEQLWTWPAEKPSLGLHSNLLEITLRGQMLILRCNRQYLRQRLLDDGYRAFFDRIGGGGSAGWRLDFFCLDPAAVGVLRDTELGEWGPGDLATFDPEKFVLRRLRQMERAGRLGQPNEWWDLDL
jgi:hypothetical protein